MAFSAIKREIIKRWKGGDNVIIDSRCGAVRNFIRKLRPDLIDNLVKTNSTLYESARLARQENGEEFVLCFVGPDIAYKEAVNACETKAVDAILTWHEFDVLCGQLLDDSIDELEEGCFDEFSIQKKKGFIPDSVNFEETLMGKVPYVTLADKRREEISAFLETLDISERKGFIEILFCGSCIHGPGVFSRWRSDQERQDSGNNIGGKAATGGVIAHEAHRPIVNIGVVNMRDNYTNTGQTGAIGRKAHAHDMNFQQVWDQSDLDLRRLVQELAELRTAMKKEAEGTADQDGAIDAVATAEKAAAQGDGPAVLRQLKTAGKWTLGIAEKIGVAVAAEAIKRAM